METSDTEREIRSFLVENFLFGRSDLLKDDDLPLGSVIDSTGTIELVMFLQDHFVINVEDEDMIPQNFGSVKTVVAYVTEKLRQRMSTAPSSTPEENQRP